MTALYISPHLSAQDFGGSLFAATNLQLLREVYGSEVTAAAISRTPRAGALAVPSTRSKLGTALANAQGLCGTLSRPGIACLRDVLLRERPELVWLDTSILGALIPMIRRLLPGTKVICAFQNVEADLIKQRLAAGQLHYLPALYATWLNERRSARASDATVALHAADAARIESAYGRPVDHILPIIVSDLRPADVEPPMPGDHGERAKPYVLFVGSATPPNLEALEFIGRHVAPALGRVRVVVAGTGMDRFAGRFRHPQLDVIGFVKDLSLLYRGAAAVIAPIVSGGGMKVKIAEALMHGKLVIATPFAALGYEQCGDDSIRLARTSDEFALLIDERLDDSRFNAASRACYERLFSHAAGVKQVARIVTALSPKPGAEPRHRASTAGSR